MKRKLLNGVMLLAALTAVGTLSSCKDYDSEQLIQQQYNGSFSAKLTGLETRVQALEDAMDAQKTLNTLVDQRLTKLEQDLLNLGDTYYTKTEVNDLIDAIKQCTCPPGGGGTTTPTVTDDHIREIVKGMFTPNMDAEIKAAILGVVNEALTDLATIKSRLTQVETDIRTIKGDITTINQRIDDLIASGMTREEVLAEIAKQQVVFDAKILALQTDLNAFRYTINTLKTGLDQANNRIDELSNSITSIYNQIGEFSSRLNETQQKAVQALTMAENNKRTIDQILTNLAITDLILNRMDGDISRLKQEQAALKTQYNELDSKLTDALADVYSKLDNVYTKDKVDELINDKVGILQEQLSEALESKADNEQFQQLVGFVNNLASEFAALQGQVNDLLGIENRLNSLITSVIVQGVYNPLFGSFSLPIGVQSNMLLGYYGMYKGDDFQFPTYSSANNVFKDDAYTDEEWMAINAATIRGTETFESGDFITTGNMGKIYMTLNPNNVDVSGAKLTLERSNGVASEVRPLIPQKSNEEITFGYTRAENGFYVADVDFDATYKTINSMKYEITPGLKGALKDAIQNHTKADLFNLLRKVYDQLTMNLPAYGLKAAWNVDGKDYATFSKYEIATVLFTPLSYTTLKDASFDKKLPTFSPISEAIIDLNKYRDMFDLSDLDIEVNTDDLGVKFELSDIEFKLDASSGNLYIDLSGRPLETTNGPIEFAEGTKLELSDEGLKDFMDELNTQLNTQLNGQIGSWNAQLKDSFQEALEKLAGRVQSALEDALKKMEGEINGQINDMLDDIQGSILNRVSRVIDFVNKFIGRYNDAADRINGWLKDPNHLLQPTMLYNSSNGAIHRLSSDFTHPTGYTVKGGNGIELYATSNTAEILAPAYKKFVAVAGEWDAAGNRTVDQRVYRDLNNSDHMATVLPGNQIRVAVPTAAMKKGYKYEIIYSAVDYHGYISTQRFYITIK